MSNATLLSALQYQYNVIYIPTFIFLVSLFVLGICGNTLILFVYWRKGQKTTTSLLIQCIAGLDLVTNVVIIPCSFYYLLHVWDTYNKYLCKTFFFLTSFFSSASALLLLDVAIVRYRKICKPYDKQITIKQAKQICASTIILSVLLSAPYLILYGQLKDKRDNLTFYTCGIDESFHGSDRYWPKIFHATFILVFFISCTSLSVMYIFIGKQSQKHSILHGIVSSFTRHKHTTISETNDQNVTQQTRNSAAISNTEETSHADNSSSDESDEAATTSSYVNLQDIAITNSPRTETSNAEQQRKSSRRRHRAAGRTTRMLSAISLFYIVSNFSTLILYMIRLYDAELIQNMGTAGQMFYYLLLWGYLANSAFNPIIYSICDRNFRKECLTILKRK